MMPLHDMICMSVFARWFPPETLVAPPEWEPCLLPVRAVLNPARTMSPSRGLTVPRQSVGNESLMFHGASPEALIQICKTGFDRRLAGSNHGAVR